MYLKSIYGIIRRSRLWRAAAAAALALLLRFEISSGDHKAAAAAAHGRQSVRATGRCLRGLRFYLVRIESESFLSNPNSQKRKKEVSLNILTPDGKSLSSAETLSGCGISCKWNLQGQWSWTLHRGW